MHGETWYANDPVRRVNAPGAEQAQGPWNPGIQSQVPKELRHLSTIFRPENVFTSIAAADENAGVVVSVI